MKYKRVINNYTHKEKKLSLSLIYLILGLILINIISNSISSYKQGKLDNMYTEYINENFIGINPLYANLNNHNSDLSSLLYRGLVKYNPDKKIFESDIADFIINNDSTVFKFVLKDELYWTDGKKITSDDVIYTYNEIIKDPNYDNLIIKSNFEGVNIYQNENNEIIFELEESNQFFISNLTIGILPSHKKVELEEKILITEDNCDTCIFSGDFDLEKITTDEGKTDIILSSNLDIENLRFIIGQDLNEIKYNSNFYKQTSEKYYLLPKYTALFLNNNQEFLNNIHLRKAIKMITDKEKLMSLLPEKININSPYFSYDTNAINKSKDKEYVKNYLIENGFTYKEETLFFNDKPVRISIIKQKYEINIEKNTENKILSDYFVEQLKEIGINIVVHNYDTETFQELLLSKNYDMAIFGHDLGDNLDSYSFWHSTQTYPGGLNVSNYQNLLTDKLLENLRKTSDTEKSKELVKEFNVQINKFVPAIFLYTDKHGFEVDNKIKNRKILESYTKPSDRFFDIKLWTINNF